MTNGQIYVDNLKDFMDKFSEESESNRAAEYADKIKKCVEEGKQRLN